MSLGVLLAKNNKVIINDIDEERIKKINNLESTIKDDEISEHLKNRNLSITATSDKHFAYGDAEFIIVATPTNYDEEKNYFDTSILDKVVDDAININKTALIIIKSTIPLGYTNHLQKKYKTKRITFSPEFLREGQALKDNLYPSRIIIGSECKKSKKFTQLLRKAAEKKEIDILYMNSNEAEAVKLFANNFLALRVAFFNELDSYAMAKDLSAENIIKGVCLDSRIGGGYNNPSFGYGGYCLPKDTKQLLSDFKDVPQKIIKSIVSSNKIRKDFLSNHIISLNPKSVGIYRLTMKQDSDNYRSSAVQDIMNNLVKNDIEVIIYEPSINGTNFENFKIENDLRKFKKETDLIIANRSSDEISDVSEKVFSRDIFNNN